MKKHTYTLEELDHLRNVRLIGYDASESFDDLYTNDYSNFFLVTTDFFLWLKNMEAKGKIKELLESMPKECFAETLIVDSDLSKKTKTKLLSLGYEKIADLLELSLSEIQVDFGSLTDLSLFSIRNRLEFNTKK